MVMAIDDEACMEIFRLFNEPEGKKYLVKMGVPETFIASLNLLGISGIANLLSAIKMAKWYGWGEEHAVMTVLTDSSEMYGSRLKELAEEKGKFTAEDAAISYHRYLMGAATDNMEELTLQARKRIHNLKYYTWIEQQGRTSAELNAQWEDAGYWKSIWQQADAIDALINEFNGLTGLLKK
jgi:hypothetical protein